MWARAAARLSATGLKPAPMATGRYWLISDKSEGAALDAAARFAEFMTSADSKGNGWRR